MKYGLTLNDLKQAIESLIEAAEECGGDAVITEIDTIRIEENGFYRIGIVAQGDYGNTYAIAKWLVNNNG